MRRFVTAAGVLTELQARTHSRIAAAFNRRACPLSMKTRFRPLSFHDVELQLFFRPRPLGYFVAVTGTPFRCSLAILALILKQGSAHRLPQVQAGPC